MVCKRKIRQSTNPKGVDKSTILGQKKKHFADNLNNLIPGGSEQYDRLWKLRTLFDKLLKDYQAMQPESHQLIDEHMCKFKGKSLMRQYMKNEQIKRDFKFWFCCVSKLGYLMILTCTCERKRTVSLDLVNELHYHFVSV